ncbi:MAG: hypothetical protein KA757_08090 [Vogesella sp.]|nr:hypothetical protein [Vogesella sp.]
MSHFDRPPAQRFKTAAIISQPQQAACHQDRGTAETGPDGQNPFCMKIFYDSAAATQAVFAKDNARNAERNKTETTGKKKPARRPVFM